MVDAKETLRDATIERCAAKLGISASTLSRAIAAGCPHDKLSARHLRVNITEVRRWLAQRSRGRASTK